MTLQIVVSLHRASGYFRYRHPGHCERRWSLARERGFANEFHAFKRFCNRQPKRAEYPSSAAFVMEGS
jgi:hypothetical protein